MKWTLRISGAGFFILFIAAAIDAQRTQGSGTIPRLLAAGSPVFGVFSGEQTAAQGERSAGESETDFVFYSLERGPFDLDAMQHYAEAMREAVEADGRDDLPLVLRIPPIGEAEELARERARRAVAAGVAAIVFPHTKTAGEAAAAVRSLEEAGSLWPLDPDGRLVTMLIVEDREGVENASAIAATPGVGVVFAGPGDLRRAYDGDAEAVETAIEKVLAACRRHEVPCGITAGRDDIARRLLEGFQVIIVTENEALAAGRRAALRIRKQELNLREDLLTPRPIAALDSVWIEELTWMEVRDGLAAGKTTAIVASGGIEQNGPYLATGKHNVVLRGACEGIARELGNALCAPILKLVPEGAIDPPSGHMRYPGTLSLREETFRSVLDDTASSLRSHGFEHIVLIGDSGGNQRGMEATARVLNERWGERKVHYIPEFYRYQELIAWMDSELGIVEPEPEGLHDDFAITAMMISVDPESVRFDQRVEAGKATINGVELAPLEKTAEIGRKLLRRRVEETVTAIRAAIADTASQ